MAAKPKTMILPPEIWREILIRVSVKTILRCRSVCKSWYSLVSCPNFISDYSTTNLNKNGNRVLLRIKDVDDSWSYSSHDESSMESCKHDYIPEAFRVPYVEIVGSCNGLICLCNRHNRYSGRSSGITFPLWNPTLKKIAELPSRPYSSINQRVCYLGFGFDSKTYDYKVLCVVGDFSDIKGEISGIKCEIFDLRKGVWRVICSPVPSSWSYVGRRVPDCYLDGAVHWSTNGVLLSFTFSDACFREIQMPGYVKLLQNGPVPGWVDTRTHSVTFNGLIYLIMWMEGWGDCSVWVMKEYGIADSWTNVFDINLKRSERITPLFPGFFRLWKNGEVFMVRTYHREDQSNRDLISYNPESEKYTTLFSIIVNHISDVCLYEESLIDFNVKKMFICVSECKK